MNASLIRRALLLPILMLLLTACKHTPAPVSHTPAIVIDEDTLKDDWTTADLFRTELPRQQQSMDLTDGDTAQLEIRAFRHRFVDDTSRLKPVWVLGYVQAGTAPGTETLPGPTLRANYGQPSHVRYVNQLAHTLRDNADYPYFKLHRQDRDSCHWYPILYDVRNPLRVNMVQRMLYPGFVLQNGIPVCRNTGDSLPEMASYYATTVHLHGASVSWHNDGYVNSSHLITESPYGRLAIPFGLFGPAPGEPQQFAAYTYPNNFPEGHFDAQGQPDTTLGQHGAVLWYHDHAMMRTTTNVYAGLAGAYIVQGKDEYSAMNDVYPNLNSKRNVFKKSWDWVSNREDNDISLLIADKSFSNKGFLYYNTTASPSDSDAPGVDAQPEFLGNTITVNGKMWPFMKVEAERYRFRLLNGSSTRYYRFGLRQKNGVQVGPVAADSSVFIQIGTEGGLMTNFVPVTTDQPLTLAPGERADVVIDFGRFNQNDSLMLVNYAPNQVYQGDSAVTLTTIDQPYLTNFVMAFVVGSDGTATASELKNNLTQLRRTPEFSNITANLNLVATPLTRFQPTETKTFSLTLKEAAKRSDFPEQFRLSVRDTSQLSYPMILMAGNDWNSEASSPDSIKRVRDGTEEIWAIWNDTNDRHPIHIHLNRFKIMGRRDLSSPDTIPPLHNELGWKDVVQCTPHQFTYIRIRYLLSTDSSQQYPGSESHQFVYHCHILEHEDASMMRRLVVTR